MAHYARHPHEQPNSVRSWNVPPFDDQFGHQYATERIYERGAIFQSLSRFPSDEVEEIAEKKIETIIMKYDIESVYRIRGLMFVNYYRM